ncbi:protein of unknown function DUF208 [Aminomonas paucivorans DSM 12260]|uniref:Epoxyqueuosine reductase QueH n=1 Tax=Aminomonas paucivorans DSM 12260 TaxID=584708 RepID=E3CUI8_9BACT|nr:epoxyqueuosine reductase QueH [Aminomonas paucivorans]EFQ24004.1 protein of unknown function DUF208 [Aminomonas paucivorans DSM 12260]
MESSKGIALLLHLCCAPDGTVPWPDLEAQGFRVTGYFTGHHIHPEEEYRRRAESVRALAESRGGAAVFEPYDPPRWLEAVAALKHEPEGGRRCGLCFALQLLGAARAAQREGCTHLCTTLTISPHKDPERINRMGRQVASQFGLLWEDRVWRKNDGFKRSVTESHRLGLYRQTWCGCVYSRREGQEG